MNEASYLIAAEVLKHLQYKKISVQTPLTKLQSKFSSTGYIGSNLKSGLGLLEGFVKFCLMQKKVTLDYIATSKLTSLSNIYLNFLKLKIKKYWFLTLC